MKSSRKRCSNKWRLQWHQPGSPPSPKLFPFLGGSAPPSNARFPGPTQVRGPNGISIDFAVFEIAFSKTFNCIAASTGVLISANADDHLHIDLLTEKKTEIQVDGGQWIMWKCGWWLRDIFALKTADCVVLVTRTLECFEQQSYVRPLCVDVLRVLWKADGIYSLSCR